MNLQDSFKEFCKQNKYEINPQQTEIIEIFENFLNLKESFFNKFFKKKKNFVFICMEKLALVKQCYTILCTID